MSFPEGERYPTKGVFPEIKKEDLDHALAEAPFLDGAWNFHGVIMVAEDRFLHRYLTEFVDFFRFEEDAKKGFLDGAARFYMVLRFLDKKGYGIPKISESTIASNIHEINQFNDLASSFPNGPPQTKEELDRLREMVSKTEFVGFGVSDVATENPQVGAWMSATPLISRMGAMQVYVLKRKQIEADRTEVEISLRNMKPK
jgi:hypothetical protein